MLISTAQHLWSQKFRSKVDEIDNPFNKRSLPLKCFKGEAILILLFREFYKIGKIPWNSHIVLLLCWIISREFYKFGKFPWNSVKVRAIPLRIFWEFCKIRKIPSNSHIVLNQPVLLSCRITLHFSKGSYLNTVQIQDYMCWFTLLNLRVIQKKYSLIQVSTFWSMIWFKQFKISHF